MSKALILLFTLLCVTPASAQLGGRLRELIANRRQASSESAGEELSYGRDPLQKLDYWKPTTPGSPIVIYVHGGGWKRGDKRMAVGEKGEHCLQQGYAFASVNYRLVPACTVEDQAQDVANAIAYLIRNAEKLGFDGKRVALMGHSAGAHLVGLVGTDLRFLKIAEVGTKAIRGAILLDGAAYDVPRQIAEGGDFMHDTYLEAFGTEPNRQKGLSPTVQAAAPNVRAFLILHVQREDGTVQSNALGEALRKAGTPAEVKGFEGQGLKGHMEINRDLGKPDYPATPVVDAWLKKVFAK
ncbi:MAG: alpha/beta hydrolase [Prosthecobacter sp.]|uniref:alpha/beta hydrolase n=1 Tax=Prosthecobacter sp. TaxID=1965333 RepID=UPI00261AD266|nr:alpha/beta hydrolase [Prosthecobacter sp.]MCF7789479.1 alpha/beta hydrolase [Prosthecobacter sp.]